MNKRAQLKVKAGVAGKYRLRVGREGEAPRIDTGWFDNLVTDAGLNYMGGNANWLDACQVGTDNTTPANADTALGAYVAGTTTQTDVTRAAQGSAPYYGSTTITYRFPSGTFAGEALAEVGIGTASSGGTLFSRALITDGGGSPTTVTVLADEFLDVTYQIQIVPPTGDITVSDVTDSGPAGTVHSITLRASEVTTFGSWEVGINGDQVALVAGNTLKAYDGAIGAITTDPAGTSEIITSISNDAYSNLSLERTASISFDLDDANFGTGLKSIKFKFDSGGSWQAEFDPVISKTATDTLSIDVSVSWTRTTAL